MRIFTTFIVVLFTAFSAHSISKPPGNDCSGILAGLSEVDPSLPAADFRANNVSFDPSLDPRTNISLNKDKAILFSFVDQLNILQVGDLKTISDQLMELKMDEFENYNEQLIQLEVDRDELASHIGHLINSRDEHKKSFKQKGPANDNFDPEVITQLESEIDFFKEALITTHEEDVSVKRLIYSLKADHTSQVLDILFYSIAGQADKKYAKKYSDIYFGREGDNFQVIEDGTSLTPSSQVVHLSYAMPFEAHEVHYDTNGFKVVETSNLVMDPTLKKLLRIFAILRLDYSHQLVEEIGDAFREYYHLVQYFSQVNAQALAELISHPVIGLDKALLHADGIGVTNLQDFKDSMNLKLSYRIDTQFQEFADEPQLLQKIKGKLQDQKLVNIKQSVNTFANSFGHQLENSLGDRISENEAIKRAGAALSSGDLITSEIYAKLLTGIPLVNSEKDKVKTSELFEKESKVAMTMDFNPVFNLLRKSYVFSTVTVHNNNQPRKLSKKKKLSRSDLTVITNEQDEQEDY